MLAIRITLPHGRYHATPWGHHVNEGLVEWPPSPWRLLRALVATGYTKLGWSELPAQAVDLVQTLAGSLPEYQLPPATVAHSRHFMPIIEGRKVNTTKVIDTFVRTEIGASIGVSWPITLASSQADLLRALVERLGYLGRAESWVTARVVHGNDLPGGIPVRASEHGVEGCEPIRLIAPLPPDDYARWREAYESDVQVLAPKRKSRSNPTAPALLPVDVAHALEADTGALQNTGWNAPPGTRRVLYWRPEGALEHRAFVMRRRPVLRARHEAALLALSSDTSRGEVLPLLSRVVPQAELLHRALLARLGDPPQSCPELSGKDELGQKLRGRHEHVHFVPLDIDGDRRLDHFLLWAPMGFGDAAEDAIRTLRRTWTKGGDKPFFVTLAGIGRRDDFVRLGGDRLAELSEARVWMSRTPFVPPRHLKAKRHSIADQVQAELASRGLPRASCIEVSDAKVAWDRGFQRFVRTRRDRERQPPAAAFFHLRLELESSVRGPLLLGYASHFGLGLFVPAP